MMLMLPTDTYTTCIGADRCTTSLFLPNSSQSSIV